jgi:signal transduction histidine kinase
MSRRPTDNGGVTWTSSVTRRGVVRLRRLSDSPDLPLAVAALLATLGLLEIVASSGEPATDVSRALALVLCTTVPLAFVRSHVLVVAVTITAALVLTLLSGEQPTIAGVLSETGVLYLVALRASRQAALLFAVPFVAWSIWPVESGAGGKSFAVVLLLMTAGALGAGSARRAGGEAAQRTAADWAYADTVLDHAARGERARIARELHDIVAHHISMISVQAETARLTTPGMPVEGASRLLTIGDTARQALTEMRRLLGVLRDDAAAAPTRRPQPSLDQLITLADEARGMTGASIRIIVQGRVVRLDPGIELTAYRIVQEALTNARRHAPGAAVDIELHYLDGALHLRIRDSGPGCPGDGALAGGHGLIGMRERAAMAGGTFVTAQDAAGGFVIEVVLPTPEAAP